MISPVDLIRTRRPSPERVSCTSEISISVRTRPSLSPAESRAAGFDDGIIAIPPRINVCVAARRPRIIIDQNIVASAADKGIVALAGVDIILAGAAGEIVVVGDAEQLIHATAAIDRVIAGATVDNVVAAEDIVPEVIAIQDIVAIAAADDVLAAAGGHDVVAIVAVQDIVAATVERRRLKRIRDAQRSAKATIDRSIPYIIDARHEVIDDIAGVTELVDENLPLDRALNT